jgi:ADP-ribose pyrophosphatase
MSDAAQFVETSCGAVIFKDFGGAPKFLLVRSWHGKWGFAKGHIEAGESEKETALREIREETGLREIEFIDGFRVEESYMITGTRGASKGLPTQKTAIYFLCKTCGEPSLEPNDEIIETKWFNSEDAFAALRFDGHKRMFEQALAALRDAGFSV